MRRLIGGAKGGYGELAHGANREVLLRVDGCPLGVEYQTAWEQLRSSAIDNVESTLGIYSLSVHMERLLEIEEN